MTNWIHDHRNTLAIARVTAAESKARATSWGDTQNKYGTSLNFTWDGQKRCP